MDWLINGGVLLALLLLLAWLASVNLLAGAVLLGLGLAIGGLCLARGRDRPLPEEMDDVARSQPR